MMMVNVKMKRENWAELRPYYLEIEMTIVLFSSIGDKMPKNVTGYLKHFFPYIQTIHSIELNNILLCFPNTEI